MRRPAIALKVLGLINLLSLGVVLIALGIALFEFMDRGQLFR